MPTYTTAGTFNATLTVTDVGQTGSADPDHGRQHRPTVTITVPRTASSPTSATSIPYEITVTDPEDGTDRLLR